MIEEFRVHFIPIDGFWLGLLGWQAQTTNRTFQMRYVKIALGCGAVPSEGRDPIGRVETEPLVNVASSYVIKLAWNRRPENA